ncbi:unnamed protein product [Caretta caretta]
MFDQVEGGPTPLHTSKRGISADGSSTSPETTQRVTSILPDACPASETTQRVSRPLPDAPPAGPLDPTRPRREEPASDTAGATGTPPLQGNEDTVYLQYPLAADALICPICFPPRSFHLLGGVTRHLKRCHNKRVAFSCALCSLPFETQKQCKAHQVTCRKRSKGTARPPAPAPSPAAVRRPTTPEPQQRTAMVQAAVKKAAPVARPAQQGAAIEKVPAAAGNATQVLGSRRPVSPSHVARQISILRRLSTTSPPAQHVPVPRRISAPSRIVTRVPVAGGARATPQAALRTPTAGGARAAPQSALQTPAAEGASAQPQAAQQAPRTTGETNPAATENHRALLTRQPSTTPESIQRDAANSGSHVPAAAAQAPATPRRTSNVPAIPEPDRVPPTTSSASIPPEIPPQPPTEGNDGSRDGRLADCEGDESASDKVEDHEGQQPVERAATPWQTAWTAELRATASFDDFDLLKAPQAATTKKTLGASRTLQSSSTKRKTSDCPKDPLRDAVPDRSRTQRPACRDITARRNIPAAPQQRQPPRASPPALQQLLTKSPPALQQHQLPPKSPPTPPLQEAPRASPPALQQLLTKSPPALQQHQPPPESPPTPPLQEAPRQPPPTPAAAQVVEGGPTPLHTSKRGISADGSSTSPETTQRVTSILPDACPASETTQRVSRPLPDAPPAGPLDPTRPRREEPASDTAGATGTPPLQGNEDTVYLQYPLAADALICPICFPPRSFHLLGGVTRHLKRCHNKRVAFSCALCSLPFETQKQCKAHQVTCRKRSKGTARPPAPAPSPAAVRRPTTPEPQQRTAMVQAAVKKAAPVARPAQQGAAIEKVPAAAGNATQVLGSRRPVSPSHVARQISILRRLSTTSPPAQHVPVPRRISAPSRIVTRVPVAGGARATPQAALRTPTAGGARAAPQSALQTPAAEGASAQPQAAQQAPRTTGETNPAATENHRALLTRQPSTTPESIQRDAANSGSHVPAAAAQAPATPRRTSNVPAIPEPDRVPPTTSSASIPPEIPPQPPTEGNDGSRDGRLADCEGDESASDKVEDHEGQQPVERAATPWQTAWTAELRATASFDDFDLLSGSLQIIM